LHNIDVTLLNSVQKTNWYADTLSAQGFDNDQLGTYHLQAGTTQSVKTNGSSSESIGQMARATYTYDNKYSVTGTIRHDGYTAFSTNHKWGNFSSLGLNWNITREGFMKNVTSVNNLALRMSYGTVGNQSIPKYSTLSAMQNGYYNYVGDPSYTPTQVVNTLGNSNLKWESTTGWNGGIDFSVLHGRLSGSIDGYITRTNNLAFTLNVPYISGFPNITANAGEIRNHGIELNLRSINVQSGKFTWSSEASFSLNRNKVTHLLGNKNPDGSEANIIAQATNSLFIGKSLGSIYDYQITGMWQVSDSTKGTIMKGYRPGEYAMLDRNNDGKISSDSDRAVIGRTVANFRWSFTNTFTYGDWSLLVYLNSIWGGNGYFMNGGNTPYTYGYANTPSINVPVYDYWTPSNPNAIFPRLSYKNISPVVASKYFDRSFIRLQKVAIGYNATKFVKRYGIGGLNLALSADNLATYAPHWVGLDAATGAGNTVSSIPSLRTFTFNVNINF
jgi:hypothetical protein